MATRQVTVASLPQQFRREYNSWKAMRNRCGNPNNPSWRYYGAKGIRVCQRWASFAAFLEDMGPAPKGHSLDRLDNSRDYEPGNCHWSTPAEQQQNTSKVRYLEYRGVRLSVTEWAGIFDVPRNLITDRIDRLGWGVERAIKTPPDARFSH